MAEGDGEAVRAAQCSRPARAAAGESDGSCDIAGGARAWDFGAYNPWDLPADAQTHFDALWGMVDPAAGAWFPQQALELARNATPPLF